MPYSRYQRPARGTSSGPRQAAIFVDYANLHALLAERLDDGSRAAEYIAEGLDELRRYLADEDRTETVLGAAYADFGALGVASPEEDLYLRGLDPRYVPAGLQDNASEVQLCLDAIDALHRRPGVQTFAIVSGDRAYRPLVRMLRGGGRHAFVAALDPPPPGGVRPAEQDVFMSLLNLLGSEAQSALRQHDEHNARREGDRAPVPASDYARLDDPMLFRTLEIAEEHFGQYEEVYLTPLLRKLSDVLGERFDPKVLVSDLEEAHAVRLEKRRGYPYDYTVLIVNHAHPDVQQMEDDFYGPDRPADDRPADDRAEASDGESGSPSDHADDPPLESEGRSAGYDDEQDRY